MVNATAHFRTYFTCFRSLAGKRNTIVRLRAIIEAYKEYYEPEEQEGKQNSIINADFEILKEDVLCFLLFKIAIVYLLFIYN